MALLPPSFTFLINHQNHTDEDTAAEIWARAKANGYQSGAFKAKDNFKGFNKHVDKVKQDRDQMLKLYIK
jgi:hypothetical protein